MFRLSRAPFFLALAALILLIAGCGGHSTNVQKTPPRMSAAAYKRRLARLNLQETLATKKVTKAARTARSVPQLRRALVGYANEQAQIGAEIGFIHPPKKAERANALLSKGFIQSAAQLKAFLPRLRLIRNPHAALILIEHNQPQAGVELDRAAAQLKKLGFSPGSRSSASGGAPR